MAEGNLPASPDPFDPTTGAPPAGMPHPIDADAAAAHQPAGVANVIKKPGPPPKKKRRRRWPFVLLALVLLLALLVLLAPTIAGTSPVRSVILGQVNQRINGRIDVADWSLGWTSPVSVSGLKVFDKAGSLILELPRLTTELRLIDAARGKLHFGQVTVDGLSALVRRDPQGNVNLTELSPPSQPTPPSAGPTKLPDVSGELHLVNCRVTFEDRQQGQTFYFPSIAGTVKCPDINGPIENNLEVACKVGDAPAGKLTINGRADVADANEIKPDKMDVDEKVTVQGVELGGFGFALGKDSGLQKLSGMTSGAVSLRYRGGEGAGLEAQVTSTGFAAGGPALKGDTFATQKLELVVPPTTLAMPGGSSDWKAWTLRVGSSGGPSQITVTMDQGAVALGADAPLRALSNLGDNLPPGAAGQITTNVNLDVGALARQMPHVLAVQEGLTLDSGRFTHAADVQLAVDRATVKRLEAHLVDVRGRRGQQPVSLQPINLNLSAASFGGGWKAPNVRDLNLALDSGFANASFTGRDLADLQGNAKGDLQRLRDELGQVFDLGDLQLAGPFDVQIASKGDVAAGGNATVSTTVNVTNLVFGTAKDQPPLRQSRVRLEARGEVVRRPDGSVDQLRSGRVVLNTGDAAKPTVAAQITIPSIVMASAPATAPAASTQPGGSVTSATYQIAQLAVDLPKAKAEFGSFLPALNEYAFDRGQLNVTGGGKYDPAGLTYDGRVAVADLTMARLPAPPAGAPAAAAPSSRIDVISGYSPTIDAGFVYAPQGTGGARIDVTKLAVADDRVMLGVKKAADQPLRLVTSPAGTRATGRLELSLDLKQLNDLRERLGATSAAVLVHDPNGTELRTGRLGGTVDLAEGGAGETRLASNLEAVSLTVHGPRGDVLTNERMTLAAQARAKDDFSSAFVDRLDVAGNLLTANVSNTALQLKVGQGQAARAATTVEMVQSATVKAQLPDLGKVQALLDALSPPEAPTQASAAATDLRALASSRAVLLETRNDAPVFFAQARQAPPPDQVIGRRPQAPAPRPAPARAVPVAPPAPGGQAPAAPVPPIKLAGGAASVSLVVQRQGDRVVYIPELTGQNVVVARGEGSQTLDAVDVKTNVSFVPVAPPATAPATAPARAAAAAIKEDANGESPSIAQQIRDLQIPSLSIKGAGSTITLAEPLVISDVGALQQLFSAQPGTKAPANATNVKAALKGEGDLGQLSSLLVALGYVGDPKGEKQPYRGRYDLQQRLTAGNGGVGAAGQLNLADFVVAGGSNFNEKAVRFTNDVTLDSAKDALSLKNVSLAMESTKALELKLSGNVLDYSTKRRLENVAGTIGYDWAKLWEIVRPMLSKEQQESLKLRIAGQSQRQFALGGSYPAVGADGKPLPFNEAVKSLSGHFEGGFQLVEINGLQVQNLELPLTLDAGKLTVAYHDKPQGQNLPPAADCNSGKLNIGGAVVDLTEEAPRLSMAKGTKLLAGATLNPVFSDMFGGMINNPLFVSPSEARGLVDITVVQCDRLPLDSLVLKTARENDGRAEFLFSIKEVFLGNSTLMEALKLAGQSEFARSLQGEIRESRVIIEGGHTRQDVTINTGESDRPFRIYGSTALETKQLNLTFTIPPQLLRQLGPTGKQVAELLSDGLPIPLGGTTRAPQLDLQRAFTSTLKEGLLPGLLKRATGGDRASTSSGKDGSMQPGDRGNNPPSTEPPPAADPVKDLFDLIGKQQQKKEKDKQDRKKDRDR